MAARSLREPHDVSKIAPFIKEVFLEFFNVTEPLTLIGLLQHYVEAEPMEKALINFVLRRLISIPMKDLVAYAVYQDPNSDFWAEQRIKCDPMRKMTPLSNMSDTYRALSKIETIRNALRERIGQHRQEDTLPTSARFLYYELGTLRVISKEKTSKRRPDQDMIDALTDLRESGEIPWDWIVDETRSIEDYTGFPTIKKGVLACLDGDSIRLDPWSGEVPFTLTESRSLAGGLRGLCDQYGVRIAPTNDQCAGFLHTKVAPRLNAGQIVLYLGDFNLCGNDIENNTRRVLEREVGELEWERLALTETQVEDYRLPRITKRDKRFKDYDGVHEAVDTEALSQRIIIHIPSRALGAVVAETAGKRSRTRRAGTRRHSAPNRSGRSTPMSENIHRQRDDQEAELSPVELEACRARGHWRRLRPLLQRLFGKTNNTRRN
jgi:hypothetical protein